MQRRTVLATHRWTLTTWLPADEDDLYRLHSDPDTMRFVGPGRPETRTEVRARLRRYLAEQACPGWTTWRVTDPQGTLIGRAGFGAHGSHRELGYTLHRDHWGRGLATELAAALARWHSEHPDPADGAPTQLWAYAALENLPSRRVLEKVGFAFVDVREHSGVPCAFYVLDS